MLDKRLLYVFFFLTAILTFVSCNRSLVDTESPNVLIVGGGEHHNFDRWFNTEDSAIISNTGANVGYTDNPDSILPLLPDLDILYLSNNQPLPDPELREAIFEFVESGHGLLLVHAATWYMWDDWPEYYQTFIGGGTSSHPPFGEFEAYVVDDTHPVMESVPSTFTIADELYRFQRDEDGSEMNVLARGVEPGTGTEYPLVWTVEYGAGRIVNITLGHDGDAHTHEAYIHLIRNSIEWLHAN